MSLHFDLAAFLWLLSGLVGLAARLGLYRKFRGDLAACDKAPLDGFRKPIVQRQLEATTIQIVIKGSIVGLAVAAMLLPRQPQATEPTVFGVIATVVLVLIPVWLTVDGVREFRHQWDMLRYGEQLESITLRKDKQRVKRGQGAT